MTGWVYAVHDDDGSVVYVGQTSETPAARYRGHLRDALDGSATPFHQWLRIRIDGGDVPRVSTIERVPLDRLNERESFWIRHYASLRRGELLNVSGRNDAPGPELPETARVIAMRSKLRAAVGCLGDGPFAGYQFRSAAGLPYDDGGALDERVTDEVLIAAGYVRRRDSYVRAGTNADHLSDPAVDTVVRLRRLFVMRPPRGGVQPGPIADKLCVSDDEAKEALRCIGYRRERYGIWRIQPSAASHTSEDPTGGAS